MPGFLTHYISGQATLQVLSPNIQKLILPCERLYNLGTQGPDIFFYYVPGHLRKRSRGLGTQMHLNDLGIFLVEMARAAKNSNSRECLATFAYTAGFIMHYALDANAHPYVYAKTFQNNVPKIKNSTDHRKFETAIDIAMLKLHSSKTPSEYNQWELIAADIKHMEMASHAVSKALKNVYDRNIPSTIVTKAMWHMVQITRLLQSKKGRRKQWMELAENLTISQPLFSSLIHNQQISDENDYLNTQHSPWHAPWDTAEKINTDSFVERYQLAIEEGTQMIELLYDYVYSSEPTQNDDTNEKLLVLAEKIGNRSLKTGYTCKAKQWAV